MQNFFKNLSIKLKIYLSNTIIQTLVLTITIFSVLGIQIVNKDLNSIQDIYSQSFGKSIQVSYHLMEIRDLSARVPLTKDKVEITKLKIEINSLSSQIQKNLVEIENFLNITSFDLKANSNQNTSNALQLNRKIQGNFENFLSQIEQSFSNENSKDLSKAYLTLLNSIKEFNDILKFLVLNYNKSLESKNYQTVQLLIIGFIFSVFVSVFISFLLGYLISKPIQVVESMARRFSKGDLTIESEINSSDEIGRLSTSFFEAAQNLKNLIQEVQATATLVLESSERVSNTSQQIALGSSNQAASLEEIASSIVQLVESIDQVSLSAKDQSDETTIAIHEMSSLAEIIRNITSKSKLVDSSAKAMLSEAEVGKLIVDDSVSKMTNIFESTNRISKIIGVISDISSRTNLLSLNAAIEAARAGESGRGFSVVAEEISKLATNSQAATKQIESLIKESMDHVENGKLSIEKLVQSFSHVLESSKESVDLAGEITNLTVEQNQKSERVMVSMANLTNLANFVADATAEQTASTKEIGKAIEQVNAISQESSVHSEDFAKSTMRLSSLSEKLNSLISNFKTS